MAAALAGGGVPIRSIEYGQDAVRVVVLGALTRRDVELIRNGLSRGSTGLPAVVDLRQAPTPDASALLALASMLRDAGTRVEIVGISPESERLLAHLGVDLAVGRRPQPGSGP